MNSGSYHDDAPVQATGAQRVRLKVCGVTQPDQARALRQLGVDYLGLNFHPQSPRFVDPDTARQIVLAWGDPASTVGVFVDRTDVEVLSILESTGVGIAQLHGSEPTQTVVSVASHRPVIRAFRIKDDVSVLEARRHIEAIEAAGAQLFAALIDGYAPNVHGGTGQTVAENLVRLASDLHPRLVLAGGLNANNLTQRLHWTACWAVDVASGVETQPGVKDLEAVRAMTQCLGVS